MALDAGIDPIRLTSFRCVGGAVALFVAIVVTRPSLLRVRWQDLPVLVALGLCGAALLEWLYFIAIDRLPVGIALLLEFTAPLLVAVYSTVVLRHRTDRRVWLALALALVGLALVAQVWTDTGLDPIGVAAGCGAAVCLAAFYLLGKHALVKHHPMTLSFWMFASAALFWAVLSPWSAFDFSALAQHASLLGSLEQVQVPVWMPVLWVIVLGTIAPYALELAALRRLTPTATGIVGMSEPVIAAAIAWLWLGQSLDLVQGFGAALTLGAVALIQTARSPRPTPAT